MAGRRSAPAAGAHASLHTLGRRLTLAGAVVCAVTAPPAGAAAAALFRGRSLAATASKAAALLAAEASALAGPELVFHLAATGLLVGCWLLGAGLVVEGLLE